MRVLTVFLLVCGLCMAKAIILDDLFGGHFHHRCTADSDCVDGCCLHHICSKVYIGYLHQCHLSGQEVDSCGCAQGLVCTSASNIQGVAFEFNLPLGVGLCDHGNATSPTDSPLVAVEGR